MGEREGVGEGLGDCDTLALDDGKGTSEALGETEVVTLPDVVAEVVAELDRVGDGEGEAVALPDTIGSARHKQHSTKSGHQTLASIVPRQQGNTG